MINKTDPHDLKNEPFSVLVAEDDESLRLALAEMMREQGYSVIEASNGQEAIDAFELESPDIVLLDAIMPEKSGYDVCLYIRSKFPDINSMPVLMITVLDDHDSIEKAQNVGASDYLTKPIHWPLLLYRLNMLFAQKKMLAERVKIENKLQQTNKLNAIRQLTGSFAHEFNNILTSQLGYTELALNCHADGDSSKLQGYLGEVHKATLRGKILIEQLMAFCMEGAEITSCSEVTKSYSDSTKSLVTKIPDNIVFQSASSIENEWVGLDFVQFHQIMMNLVENSIDAMANGGTISVALTKSHFGVHVCTSCLEEFSGTYILLSISDTGAGIEKDIFQEIFDPFYTTKPSVKGTGHGLSVVHGIVHAAGGHICLDSGPGKGTCIQIYLPPVSAEKQIAV